MNAAHQHIDHIIRDMESYYNSPPMSSLQYLFDKTDIRSFVTRNMRFEESYAAGMWEGKVKHGQMNFYTKPMRKSTMNFIKILAALCTKE